MEPLTIVTDKELFSACEIDKSFFSFQIILATGSTVFVDYKCNKILDLTNFDLIPIFITFDNKILFYQQLLTHGKDFSVSDTENFFKECNFDKNNEYYVGYEEYEWRDIGGNDSTIEYFNLEAVLGKNKTYNNIIKYATSGNVNLVVFSGKRNTTIKNRNKKILNQMQKNMVNFIDHIKDYVRKNSDNITKIVDHAGKYDDDIYGWMCKANFFVVDGYINMDE
jgi:hypothetical protein